MLCVSRWVHFLFQLALKGDLQASCALYHFQWIHSSFERLSQSRNPWKSSLSLNIVNKPNSHATSQCTLRMCSALKNRLITHVLLIRLWILGGFCLLLFELICQLLSPWTQSSSRTRKLKPHKFSTFGNKLLRVSQHMQLPTKLHICIVYMFYLQVCTTSTMVVSSTLSTNAAERLSSCSGLGFHDDCSVS